MNRHLTSRVAARYERRFARAYIASAKKLQNKVTPEVVAEAMKGGMLDEPRNLYELIDQMVIVKNRESEGEVKIIAEVMSAAATSEAKAQGVTLMSGFRVDNPFMLEAAKKQAGNLIDGVKTETKQAIRNIIFFAIRDGEHPHNIAPTIAQMIGLSARDSMALDRFASNVGHEAKQVNRFASDLLERRAKTIARTETIRASATGQQETWRAMARDQLIDTSEFRQVWTVADDERLCALCAPMDDQSVELDVPFVSKMRGIHPSERVEYAGMTVESPPLHPNCRCALRAEFGE